VTYDNKLSIFQKFPQDLHETLNDGIVQRRVQLVQQAEGAGFHAV